MKAIRIHRYGGPEALQYEDAPFRSHNRAKFWSAFTRRERTRLTGKFVKAT